MKPIFNDPSALVPDVHLPEWRRDLFALFKKRLYAIGITGIVAYVLLHVLHAYLVGGMSWAHRLSLFVSFAVMTVVLMFLNSKTRTIRQAKIVGLLFVGASLFFFIHVGLDAEQAGQPYTFTTVAVIIFFFSTLMLAWNLWDVAAVFLMSLVAIAVYHSVGGPGLEGRVEGGFWTQPLFWNGLLNLVVTFIFCLVVRHYDNVRSAKNFSLLKEVEHQKERVENLNLQMLKELKLARTVHETLIPHKYENDRFSIGLFYRPISEIGGDYANFIFLSEKVLMFLISDVTGHGVPAALVVSRFQSEFQRLAVEMKSPGRVLNELNRFILEHLNGTGMYLTAFCGLFDSENNRFVYSNYGHPDQFLLRRGGELKPLSSQTTLIGIMDSSEIFESVETLGEGDQAVLFTDGLTEATNSEGEQFGEERVAEVLRKNASREGLASEDALRDALVQHQNDSLQDDVFILSVKYKSGR